MTHPAVTAIINGARAEARNRFGDDSDEVVIELLAETLWRQQQELTKGGFRRHLNGPPGGERQDHDPHGVNR